MLESWSFRLSLQSLEGLGSSTNLDFLKLSGYIDSSQSEAASPRRTQTNSNGRPLQLHMLSCNVDQIWAKCWLCGFFCGKLASKIQQLNLKLPDPLSLPYAPTMHWAVVGPACLAAASHCFHFSRQVTSSCNSTIMEQFHPESLKSSAFCV